MLPDVCDVCHAPKKQYRQSQPRACLSYLFILVFLRQGFSVYL